MACKQIKSVALVVATLCAVTPMTDAARQYSPHFEMTESLVSLHVLATGNATNDVTGCDLSNYGLASSAGLSNFFAGRFTDFKEAGAGANGCVFLANDTTSGGTMVAIKLAKRAGKLQSWEDECNGMKRLRQAACSSEEQMKLAERYLPTCLEVGGTDVAPYIVMHAAPPNGIAAAMKHLHGSVGANVFAQLVGAVTALHGVGYTHNDLHNQNIVIQMVEKGLPELSLLDFGEIVPLARGSRGGNYKQDETVFARLAFRLAQCPSAAPYPDVGKTDDATSSQHDHRKAALVTCLKEKWQIDDQFSEAFVAVIDEAFGRKVPKLVPSLYQTTWVQKQQGELERKYPTPDGWCDESVLANLEQTHKHAQAKLTPDIIPVVKLDVEQEVVDDPVLCAQLCRHCPSKHQFHVCLGGADKGGCSKSPWKTDTQCHGSCACPYAPNIIPVIKAATTPEQSAKGATTPEEPSVVATTPEQSTKAATTPQKPSVVATTPEQSTKAATTPEKPSVVVTTPEQSTQAATTPEQSTSTKNGATGNSAGSLLTTVLSLAVYYLH